MKSKASVNVNSIIGSLPSDTMIEQNNSNSEICDEPVSKSILKATFDPKMKQVPCQDKHDELFSLMESKHSNIL